MSPADEQREQSRFVRRLALVLIVVLAFVALAAREQYVHPQPEEECSSPYDYPLCRRAEAPDPLATPSAVSLYLGTVLMAVLAAVLVWAGWHASVTSQAEIITPLASNAPKAAAQPAAQPAGAQPAVQPAVQPTVQPASAPPAAATAAPAVLPPMPAPAPPSGTTVSGKAGSASKGPAAKEPLPPTIRDNEITPDMIVPPKAQPKAGVDPKLIEAKPAEVKKDG